MPDQTQFAQLSDLIARCILAFERGGDAAVDEELAAAPNLAARAREHVQALRRTGLLAPPQRPTAFGPYRVLGELGTGGMGTVWLCEQETPVRRRVAVKVMRQGIADAEMLVRFQLEREALARLTDPCIARVLDAGVTDDRRPYLVMDYVQGTAIRQFCDDRRLDVAARLQLFARVCDAVQHAHQKGIVHRDLKPGNVLVVERDGEPLPVVIDFGVAKSISSAPDSAFTIEGKLLGTPEYMSPEQARGEPDIDTRTDVYSLGVLLYELLTGCLPIASERLRNLAEIGRVLGEVAAPRASARFRALPADERLAKAAPRATSPAALARTLDREIDWILQRALEKDRARRYGTAAEMAQDVRRHLAREPVSATPPSRWLAARRFCDRHRLPVALLSVAALGLLALATTSLVFWRDAAAAERAASTTSRRLEQSLDDALVALDRMVALGVEGLRTPENEAMRNGLLRTALDLHERLIAAGQGADPRLSASFAETLARAADLHDTLGETAAATPLLVRAEETLAALTGTGAVLPAPALVRCGRAHLLCADLRASRSDPESARGHCAAGLALFRRAAATDGAAAALRCEEMVARQRLSDLESDRDVHAAETALAPALPVARQLLADAQSQPHERIAALRVMGRLAWLRCETAQLQEARELVHEFAATATKAIDGEAPLTRRLAVVPILVDMTNTAIRLHDTSFVRRMLPSAITILREAIAAEPSVPGHRHELALCLMCEATLGDQDAARIAALEREAIALFESSAQFDAGERAELIGALIEVAMKRLDERMPRSERERLADLDEAERLLHRADELWGELPAAQKSDRHAQETWTGAFRVRADLAAARGDADAELASLTAGQAYTDEIVAAHPEVVQLRLIAIEMRLRRVRTTAVREPAVAVQLTVDSLEALVAEAPRYADPVLWSRLQWTVRFAEGALTATVPVANPEQRAAMATALRALAEHATHAGRAEDAGSLRRLAEDLDD
ncbi:MAG: protein kinase [Planctomycetota bacterium]